MDQSASRTDLRSRLLGARHAPKSKVITLFGDKVEMRQPSIKSILDLTDNDDEKYRSLKLLIEYAYVPGTDEKLFEPADLDVMLQWPASEDLVKVQQAIAELSRVDVEVAKEELRNPLEDGS